MIKLIREDTPKVNVGKEEPSREELEQEKIEFKEGLDTYSKEDLMEAIINFLRDLGFNV